MLSARRGHAGKHLYQRFLQNKIEVLPIPPSRINLTYWPAHLSL